MKISDNIAAWWAAIQMSVKSLSFPPGYCPYLNTPSFITLSLSMSVLFHILSTHYTQYSLSFNFCNKHQCCNNAITDVALSLFQIIFSTLTQNYKTLESAFIRRNFLKISFPLVSFPRNYAGNKTVFAKHRV